MKYTVQISAPARKQIKRMPKLEKKKILDKIDSLSNDPRPFGYKKLHYYNEYFRVRVGNYRIIYTIQDKQLVVVIVEVPDRRDAY
ncbi:type II toxin-antitoxin system RelE/ParE family toxin [soil metagenome]